MTDPKKLAEEIATYIPMQWEPGCEGDFARRILPLLERAREEWEKPLREALRHIRQCSSCAEGPWSDCEEGRAAAALLAAPPEEKRDA